MSENLRLKLIEDIMERWADEEKKPADDYLEEIADALDVEVTPLCIPSGYRQVAVRKDRLGVNKAYFSAERNLYITIINGIQAGPYTLDEIRGLIANYKDVVETRGRHFYIPEDEG